MPILIVCKSKSKAKKYIKEQIELEEKTYISFSNSPDIIENYNKRGEIKVDEIRNYIKQIQTKPANLKHKYLCIFDFNKANVSSQNAFLKTLEEGSSTVFLHAQNKAGILDTIISRVVTFNLTAKSKFNKNMQDTLTKIVDNSQIQLITELCKENDLNKIIENIEYYIHKNKVLNSKAIEKLYLLKKRSRETNLNKEIQVTNVVIELIQ